LGVDDKLFSLGIGLCALGVGVLVHCGGADSTEKTSILCFVSLE
jgi:hypothetical protein